MAAAHKASRVRYTNEYIPIGAVKVLHTIYPAFSMFGYGPKSTVQIIAAQMA
jgi:hypothetical protein